MSAFNLTTCMDGIAAALVASGLVPNVYAYPVESVSVPCAVVDYPSEIEVGVTFQRGADHVVLPVFYLVGVTATKDARDKLSLALDGGAKDLVGVIEGASGAGDLDVILAEIAQVTVAGTTYLGLKFTVDIRP